MKQHGRNIKYSTYIYDLLLAFQNVYFGLRVKCCRIVAVARSSLPLFAFIYLYFLSTLFNTASSAAPSDSIVSVDVGMEHLGQLRRLAILTPGFT